MKGFAILGIVIHHWFLYIPHYNYLPVLSSIAVKLSSIGGTLVHLFFILSGYGLYISYHNNGINSWILWAKKRVVKILIPYWIIVLFTYLLINNFQSILPHHLENGYSSLSLLSYIFLFRNIYPPSWGLNYTFWFMPVIIGLYMVFPIFVRILEKYGARYFLFISLLINYISITFFVVFDLPIGHQSDWFMFYIIQFSLGILLAHHSVNKIFSLYHISTLKLCFLGFTLYALSLFIKNSWISGSYYNDIFTSAGGFLIVFCIYRWITKFNLRYFIEIFGKLGKESYTIYLIHYPLIMLLVEPTSNSSLKIMTESSFMLISGVVFCLLVLPISIIISKSLNNILSVLSH